MKTILSGMAMVIAGTLASPAAAQPLWENVEAGMTAQQARALYPASGSVRHRPDRITIRGHSLIEQCRADVHILHRNGSVGQIVLRGEPAMAGACAAAVLEGLALRLGRPLSEETGRPSILRRPRTTYLWNDNGRFLRFVRFLPEGPGGLGLGNASWEMTVSTSDQPVTL